MFGPLKDAGKRLLVGRLLKEVPAVQKTIRFLVDTPGVKRGIAAVAGAASVVLRHTGAMFDELCAKGYEVACGWQLGAWSEHASTVATLVDKWLVPGLDVTTIVLGIVGVVHARMRR